VTAIQTWSYRHEVFEVDEEAVLERLNAFGAQGWECFQIEAKPLGVTMTRFTCWLRRAGWPRDPGQAELV
jgi:hypothetical protein